MTRIFDAGAAREMARREIAKTDRFFNRAGSANSRASRGAILFSRIAHIQWRTDKGDSARSIVRTLVIFHGAELGDQGDGTWTIRMLDVSASGPFHELLTRWCAVAKERAERPARSLLPRIGVRPNCSPGLDDDPDDPVFDGWVLIFQWRRHVAELAFGRRA